MDNLALAVLLVVPKRHAKRAVTRNLIKRQMREAVRRHAPACRPPATMIRLRSAFSARQYPCAASGALRAAVRNELDHLFSRCARS